MKAKIKTTFNFKSLERMFFIFELPSDLRSHGKEFSQL